MCARASTLAHRAGTCAGYFINVCLLLLLLLLMLGGARAYTLSMFGAAVRCSGVLFQVVGARSLLLHAH